MVVHPTSASVCLKVNYCEKIKENVILTRHPKRKHGLPTKRGPTLWFFLKKRRLCSFSNILKGFQLHCFKVDQDTHQGSKVLCAKYWAEIPGGFAA